MKVTALIMAGGRGERFWPRSRITLPKQFLNITDSCKTMIQLTIERVAPLVAPQDVFVLTNERYAALAYEQVCQSPCGVPRENVLFEPCALNTAPAIALGAAHIRKKYGDAVMLVLPSDSMVLRNDSFVRVLNQAVEAARQGENLVTVGITPTSPETGYGYINFSDEKAPGLPEAVRRVKRYVEKPDRATAERYVAEGSYLWNSGQFIMKASAFMNALSRYAPDVASPIGEIAAAIGTPAYGEVLAAAFPKCPSISVDYAVMEKSDALYTVEGDFGWDDVGSWNALDRIKSHDESDNTVNGNSFVLNCNNCIIEGKDKLIAAIGLEDLIVVDTDDVLLLCKRDQAQNIKKVLEILRSENKGQYL